MVSEIGSMVPPRGSEESVEAFAGVCGCIAHQRVVRGTCESQRKEEAGDH